MKSYELRWASAISLIELLTSEEDFVYRLLNERKLPLYIGTTANLGKRLGEHKKLKPSEPWFKDVHAVERAQVPGRQGFKVESALIHEFHPVGNDYCPRCRVRRNRVKR